MGEGEGATQFPMGLGTAEDVDGAAAVGTLTGLGLGP